MGNNPVRLNDGSTEDDPIREPIRLHLTSLYLFPEQHQRLSRLKREHKIVHKSDFIRAAINEKLDRVEGRK
jgi:predicted DNA-binding protein